MLIALLRQTRGRAALGVVPVFLFLAHGMPLGHARALCVRLAFVVRVVAALVVRGRRAWAVGDVLVRAFVALVRSQSAFVRGRVLMIHIAVKRDSNCSYCGWNRAVAGSETAANWVTGRMSWTFFTTACPEPSFRTVFWNISQVAEPPGNFQT